MKIEVTDKNVIRAKATELGFDQVGFTGIELPEETGRDLEAYLEQGHHGEMAWLEGKADRRRSPNALWSDAKTVIVLGVNYGPQEDPLEEMKRFADDGRAMISAYARNNDYHDVIKKRLKALARWLQAESGEDVKVFVDTAPVMEKPLAQQAGLGWQGKHTNLVSQDYGSWLFLGEIYTTLDLEPDPPEINHCGSCTKCLDICPTSAFTAPHQIDARRCISYLSIEHKGPIPEEFRKAMGNRIYGCDDCLSVCPWNKFAQKTEEPAFLPREELIGPKLAELAELDDAAFRQMFSKTAIKRIGRNRFLRNVMIAIGNSGDPDLWKSAAARLDDESELVREAATWALRELANTASANPDRAPADAGRPYPNSSYVPDLVG
ncbi:MAG TPA: tRNA epoxyqueuosine(34) reductase QueG [Rhodospirillaceae bacterium]|nr:tRNA epoxyqueuosine(34) reductase QueG [Rhodospirillaceae bacterium]HAA92498.1 tRNA epoxyqueuosine(34) reductase QueG [Rhodospirillaceae bacterium]HAT35298.1 tRNA epoxyqueuosine(34) reductase QueG [Rhodospirillaceae bacterium]